MRTIAIFLVMLVALPASAQQLILDGEAYDLAPGSTVTITPEGNVQVTSLEGDLVCSIPDPDPVTIDLTANPGNVLPGESSEITWNVANATSCTPTAGDGTNWPNETITLPDGSVTYTIDTTTSFTLTCSNLAGEVTETVAVSTGTVNCTGRPPIAGFERSISVQRIDPPGGSVSSYEDIWGTFPGTNETAQLRLTRTEYMALPVTIPPGVTDFAGRMSWGDFVAPIVSISECPGDFDFDQLDDACWDFGGLGDIRYAVGNIPGTCNINPGQQYFINVVYLNPNTNQNTCNSSACTFLVSPF